MSSGRARRALWAALALTPAVFGQADPVEIVRSSVANTKANEEKARQYAFRERSVMYETEKDGTRRESSSETWDVIGLEGSSYRKLIARDDKPLPPKEQKREEERLTKEAEKRRKETPEQTRNRTMSFSYHIHFTPADMARLFDVTLLREEPVDGRPAYVIEGTPKTGLRDLSSNDKELMHYRVKAWVDREDRVNSRTQMEVVTEGSRMQKGSVLEATNFRNEAGVWLEKEVRFLYNVKFFKMLSARGEMVATYSDHRKFEVESRVVEVSDAK